MSNTNVEALIRLRPVQNSNYGAIIEEHTRYWRRTKQEEEARERAIKAQEQKLQMELNKETFEIYEGLQPQENAGFLNSQIISTFEKNKPYYMALAKASAQGNLDARLILADEKRKIQSVVDVNKVYSKKIQDLEKQKAEGVYNENLDRNIERFKNSLLTGKYLLNPDWTLDVYSPALEDEIKDTSSGLSKESMVKLDSSSLFNNDFLNAQYHKKANFISNGETIASNLLDSVNGNKKETPQTKIEGVKLIKSLFGQDAVEARSWYETATKNGLVEFNKPFAILDDVERTLLAETYYEQNVKPNLQEVDNSLANANTRETIASKARTRRKAEKEEDLMFARATDEQGNDLAVDLSKDEKDLFNSELSKGGRSFTITNGKYKVGGESSTITQEVVGGIENNGDITLVVKRQGEEPIVETPNELKLGSQYKVKTDKGEETLKLKAVENDDLIFYDSLDKEISVKAKKSDLLPIDTGKTKKIVETRLVSSDDELNAIASDLGQGNLSILYQNVTKALGNPPENKNEAEGDSIFNN